MYSPSDVMCLYSHVFCKLNKNVQNYKPTSNVYMTPSHILPGCRFLVQKLPFSYYWQPSSQFMIYSHHLQTRTSGTARTSELCGDAATLNHILSVLKKPRFLCFSTTTPPTPMQKVVVIKVIILNTETQIKTFF